MDVGVAAHVPEKVRDDSELPAQSVHQRYVWRQEAWQTKGGGGCCHRVVLIRRFFFCGRYMLYVVLQCRSPKNMFARDTLCISNAFLMIHFCVCKSLLVIHVVSSLFLFTPLSVSVSYRVYGHIVEMRDDDFKLICNTTCISRACGPSLCLKVLLVGSSVAAIVPSQWLLAAHPQVLADWKILSLVSAAATHSTA